MIKYFFVVCFISLFGLTGCLTNPERVVYKTQVIAPEDALLLDCDVEPPPEREAYKKSDNMGREKLLVDHSHKQLKNVSACNVRFGEIRTWKKKQLERYSETQPKGE
jgi:uncharacterized protein YcfL